MKKRYWLRGLITGIIIYLVVLFIVFETDKGEMAGIFTVAVATYFSLVIPLCLLIGWIHGKIKNRNKGI